MKTLVHNYCLLISIAGALFLTYLTVLCFIDASVLDLDDKQSHAVSTGIAAAFYWAICLCFVWYRYRRNRQMYRRVRRGSFSYELMEI
mmetsp:Transcript_25643/g.44876  ORF Transcript_25643/g.44876 Transcript_25643/m.44876 type:complete len:88 (+) Transcript_25643:1987-2250(+)